MWEFAVVNDLVKKRPTAQQIIGMRLIDYIASVVLIIFLLSKAYQAACRLHLEIVSYVYVRAVGRNAVGK